MGFSVSKFLTTILCFLVMSSATFGATITRDLSSGWNLVSIPVGSDTDATTFLDNALTGGTANITKIWTYDGGWKQYQPGVTTED